MKKHSLFAILNKSEYAIIKFQSNIYLKLSPFITTSLIYAVVSDKSESCLSLTKQLIKFINKIITGLRVRANAPVIVL